ncbi:MAG: hypothetical protein ETSY1_01345 [Candidatus Entotheonella factor]|uniref:Uncharacterized protein n=1 Tax=Entotheonella factor TaxID=1429438 RepID=W4M091_ENTF1|nr:hypothetical protein [Candidatus Entotheonella palauensis]ETX03077.1 MAG: hypothetical protein ETSY1_01345 [Candidatus Entotheonella factor]
MASHVETTPDATVTADHRTAQIQRRHTIAAVIYFLYGLFYLFGAQYVTGMGMSERGTSTSAPMFFVIGGVIAILFPLLIHRIFAFGLSLSWPKQMQRSTLHISFTLILGLLVVGRVYSLIQLEFYAKSPLHITGLLIAALNAAFLLWAGFSRPVWISRHSEGAQ